MTDDQARAFHNLDIPVMIGCYHPQYGHLAVLSVESRAELARVLV